MNFSVASAASRKAFSRPVVWFGLLLVGCFTTGCYRFESRGGQASNDYGLAWVYERHSQTNSDLTYICSDSRGSLLAISLHGHGVWSSDNGHVWETSDAVPEGARSCASWNDQTVAPSDGGIIYVSEKRSLGWEPIQTPRLESLRHVVAASDGKLYVSGAHGTVMQSSDAKRWQDISIETQSDVIDTEFCGGSLWALTDGKLWRRSNSDWLLFPVPLPHLSIMGCPKTGNELAVMDNDGTFAIKAFSGLSWRIERTGFASKYTVLDLQDDADWVAAGASGLILRSSDHGRSWKPVEGPPRNVDLLSGVRKDGNLFLVGEQNTVLAGPRSDALTLRTGSPLVFTHLLGSRMLRYGAGGMIQPFDTTSKPLNIGTRHDINHIVDASGRLLAVTNYAGLYSSNDSVHWSALYQGGGANRIDFRGLAVSKQGRSIIAAATEGKLYTFDGPNPPKVWQHSGSKRFNAVVSEGLRVIAVGDEGERAWSSDGGEIWHEVKDDYSNGLSSVVFATGAVIAVGTDGEILRSVNLGADWSEIGEAENEDLASVSCMSNCTNLVAVGDAGSTWVSNDSGKHWDPSRQARVDLSQIEWGQHSLWATQTGGRLLKISDPTSLFTHGFSAEAFAVLQTNGKVWLGSRQGGLYLSDDDGAEWRLVQTSANGSIIALASETNGERLLAVSSKGSIISSKDGGSHWERDDWAGNEYLAAVAFVQGGAVVCGDGGLILRKEDGGKWVKVQTPLTSNLLGLTTDETGNRVWAVGSHGAVLFSKDGGKSWQEQDLRQFPFSLLSVARIKTPFDVRMVAVGTDGGATLSVDEGRHWYRRDAGNSTIRSVIGIESTQEFWAVTDRGSLLQSRDYGEHWTETDMGTRANRLFTTTSTRDGTKLYVAGEGGVFERLDRIKSEYTVEPIGLTAGPKDLDFDFNLLNYSGRPPQVSLRLAREKGREVGLYEPIAVDVSQDGIPGGYHLHVKAPILDMSFNEGQKVWFSPCLEFGDGTARCLLTEPTVLKPIVDVKAHWKEITALSIGLILLLTEGALLFVAPQYLLSLHRVFRKCESLIKGRVPFGDTLIQINNLFMVPLFAFSGRSLDAWVHRNGAKVMEREPKQWYVPLPLTIEDRGRSILKERPAPKDLEGLLHQSHLCVVGPGGAGKTSLAHQLARWLNEKGELSKANGYSAVSVFLRDRTADTMESLRLELQDRLRVEIDDELIGALIKKGRLVVILDGLSERQEFAVGYLNDLRSKLLARHIITTTRVAPSNSGAVYLKPQSLRADSLLYFMLLLLHRAQPDESVDAIPIKTQLEIAQRLEAVVRPEGEFATITPLLVETFTQKALALLRSGETLEGLPTTVAGAYLAYVREMAARGPAAVSQPVVLHIAKQVAVACLEKNYTPGGVDEFSLIGRLGVGNDIASQAIRTLLDAGLLVRHGGSMDTELRFALDPVAEYCAAAAWFEFNKPQEWTERKAAIQSRLPELQGLLRAMESIEQIYTQKVSANI